MVTSQRMRKRKANTSTPFVVKQRKDMVTDFLELMTAGRHILQPLRMLFVSYNDLATLLVLFLVNEAINVRAKNSNKTTVGTFSNFNLLCGHCMLLPFPSALTSLCAPVSIHIPGSQDIHRSNPLITKDYRSK